MNTVLLYIHDGFADWEASFILPELRNAGYQIQTVATSKNPVTSMGGLKVVPDILVGEIECEKVKLLILPGGDSWSNSELNSEIVALMPDLIARGIFVAAICGAVTALARLGVLNKVRHTSNYLPMLKGMVPTYQGESLHTDNLAESDKNVITASGIGAIEFAFQILKTLRIYDETKACEWLNFYKNGVPPSWLFEGPAH